MIRSADVVADSDGEALTYYDMERDMTYVGVNILIHRIGFDDVNYFKVMRIKL